jgi:RNA polymerase sigma factor (sigma-70 family)
MSHEGSVTRLIQRIRSADPEERQVAARMIWQRYFQDLLELARRNLDRRVRRRADEEDVVLSMFRGFCSRQERGAYDVSGRDELWKLLVTITLTNARNTARHHRRRKRDVAREQHLTVAGGGPDSECPNWLLEQMDAAGPTPVEAVVLNEALERRLSALGDRELRQVALWRLEGYSNKEISGKLDCTERSVERRLERIRKLWARYDEDR